MNAYSAPASGVTGSLIFKVVFIVAGVAAIYATYKFLFVSELKKTVILSDIHSAKTDPTKPYTTDVSKLPPLYEGGEYSVSFWMYVNDWNYKTGVNKEVISIGNRSSPDGQITLGAYLDATENTLHVRVNSANCSASAPAATAMSGPATTDGKTCMTWGNYEQLFKGMAGMAGPDNYLDCSVTPILFQRWVHVVITLNSRTVDTYVDGKLARSCVLDNIYKVDANAKARTLDFAGSGGYGGFTSGVAAYDYALNPEQVYRSYMAGPLGEVSLMDYLKSFFDPQSIGTLDYPKMN
jgi:hypothetical protein